MTDVAQLNDPFAGGSQGSHRFAVCKIFIETGGTWLDVTNRLDPYLISVRTVNRLVRNQQNQCTIELDDRDGKLPIPTDNAGVQVWLGWHNESLVEVWAGWIDSVESGFGRKQGGRRLWIDCNGAFQKGDGKSPVNFQMGSGAPPGSEQGPPISLESFLSAAAAKAGYTLRISQSLGSQTRDFWSQSGVSFHHLITQIADEFGGAVSISGTEATLAAFDGQSVTGGATSNIAATWGDNLIMWRIKPFAGRPQFGGARQHYFDVAQGLWQQFQGSIGGDAPFGNASAIGMLPHPAPNQNVATQGTSGFDLTSQVSRGQGWAQINGNNNAWPLGTVTISGARAGVDGSYLIEGVEHDYSRAGWTTRLYVSNPNYTGANGANAYKDEMGFT